MSVTTEHGLVPRRGLLLVLGLLVASFAYSALVTGSLIEWYLVWGAAAGLALGALVLSLFYRLVVALERIADRL